MKNKKTVFCIIAMSVIFVALIVLSGCTEKQAAETTAQAKKNIIDMSGRNIEITSQPSKVATIGSVPMINSLIFGMGEGDKIVNALPSGFSPARWKYQTIFAPTMVGKPQLQNANRDPNIEELLKVSPDVVFTMDKGNIEVMEKAGLPVVFLSWREPEDVKKVMQLLGDIFDKPDKAKEYIQYFDDTLKRVQTSVAGIPAEKKPKVLYCSAKTLTQPHLIVEWWTDAAGGISVTNNGRTTESVEFSIEQMLKWDPDILILSEPKDVDIINKDERFSKVKAVVNKKVYVAPVGAHTWANRTIEQPLTILWAAKTFYPEQFKDLDIEKEMKDFYSRFFGYQLSDQEAREIISGTL